MYDSTFIVRSDVRQYIHSLVTICSASSRLAVTIARRGGWHPPILIILSILLYLFPLIEQVMQQIRPSPRHHRRQYQTRQVRD